MFIFSYKITCLKYFNKHCSKEEFETEGGEEKNHFNRFELGLGIACAVGRKIEMITAS